MRTNGLAAVPTEPDALKVILSTDNELAAFDDKISPADEVTVMVEPVASTLATSTEPVEFTVIEP